MFLVNENLLVLRRIWPALVVSCLQTTTYVMPSSLREALWLVVYPRWINKLRICFSSQLFLCTIPTRQISERGPLLWSGPFHIVLCNAFVTDIGLCCVSILYNT